LHYKLKLNSDFKKSNISSNFQKIRTQTNVR